MGEGSFAAACCNRTQRRGISKPWEISFPSVHPATSSNLIRVRASGESSGHASTNRSGPVVEGFDRRHFVAGVHHSVFHFSVLLDINIRGEYNSLGMSISRLESQSPHNIMSVMMSKTPFVEVSSAFLRAGLPAPIFAVLCLMALFTEIGARAALSIIGV